MDQRQLAAPQPGLTDLFRCEIPTDPTMIKPNTQLIDALAAIDTRLGGLKIMDYDLEIFREPLRKPIGFKGAQMTQMWHSRVTLTGGGGSQVRAEGGFSVLWADDRVFLSHSEVGGNTLMATVADYGLQCARRVRFLTPVDLQDQILPEVHDYACTITKLPDLSPAFTLHALVALDHAAWLLFAQENNLRSFDDFTSGGYAVPLPERHGRIGCIPLLSYNTTPPEIVRLVEGGHYMLKINIGARGGPAEMLAADKERLTMIHRLVGRTETAHTSDGKIRYYLEANGRYRARRQVEELLDFAAQQGFLDQIALFEEPFAEPRDESLAGFPVVFAADECLRSVKDLAGLIEVGFRAVAVKPAGKGLTHTLRETSEALRLGAIALVSDSSCTPAMLDWNKNVAARLPALPGMKMGLMETNGHQYYANWSRLVAAHPAAAEPWMHPQDGIYRLGKSFYDRGGGLLERGASAHRRRGAMLAR